MTAVWLIPAIVPAEKLTLLALADIADDSGRCWPSICKIAIKTCQSERTVQRHMRTLRENGLLSIEPRFRKDRSQTSNMYRLTFHEGDRLSPRSTVVDATPRQEERGGGDSSVTQTTIKTSGIPKGTTTGQRLEDDQPVLSVVEVDIEWPDALKPLYREAAEKCLRTIRDKKLAQEILDEFSGRSTRVTINNPIRYLSALVSRAKRGEFTSELGLVVQEERRRRAETAALVEKTTAQAEMKLQKRIASVKAVAQTIT